jgi:aminopeptidase N
MVVGKFDVVDVGTKTLSMPVYAPQGRGKDVEATFGRTKDMVGLFEKVTGQPYPWDRYAQVLVWNFGSGGMENTSATTLYDACVLEPKAMLDHDADGLISHELAHQWFGDLVTCNSWEHTWLNEGFATYMSALWFEHRDGADAYQKYMLGQFAGVIDSDRGEAPGDVGMCSKAYAHPWECFHKGANPYSKGSSILHMLRMTLGDDVFFRGVQLYQSRRKFQTAETSDLRTAFEDASGRNLEKFFWQWCTRPGIPRLNIKPTWDGTSSTLTLSVEQTQKIDGDNPAWEFELPVVISSAPSESVAADDAKEKDKATSKDRSGGWRTEAVVVSGQKTAWSLKLDAPPRIVMIDPGMSVLAEMNIEQPAERWAAQVTSGPTLYSRVQACRGLRADNTTATAELLRRTASDRREASSVRIEAVKSLAARGDQLDLRALATALPDSWEVRNELVAVLPDLIERPELKDNSTVRAALEEILMVKAQQDKSSKVRCTALRALGRVKPEDASQIVAAALKVDSQSDEIRQAALEALGELDSPKSLQTAMVYAMPGHDTRTRPVAVATIAKLGHQDRDLALKTLAGYLGDSELRVRRAAGQALVDLKDERAMAEFEKAAKAARSEEFKQQIEDWKKSLREKLEEKK